MLYRTINGGHINVFNNFIAELREDGNFVTHSLRSNAVRGIDIECLAEAFIKHCISDKNSR